VVEMEEEMLAEERSAEVEVSVGVARAQRLEKEKVAEVETGSARRRETKARQKGL